MYLWWPLPDIYLSLIAKKNGIMKLEIVGKLKDDTLFDDDYIAMDPVYIEPPLEEDSNDQDGTLKANTGEQQELSRYLV